MPNISKGLLSSDKTLTRKFCFDLKKKIKWESALTNKCRCNIRKKLRWTCPKWNHFGNARKESLSGCWFVFLFYRPKHGQILQWMELQWITYLVYAFGIVCRNGEAEKQILKLRFSEKTRNLKRDFFWFWSLLRIYELFLFKKCEETEVKRVSIYFPILYSWSFLIVCWLHSVRLYICIFKTFLSYIFIERIFSFFDFYVLNKAFIMVTR